MNYKINDKLNIVKNIVKNKLLFDLILGKCWPNNRYISRVSVQLKIIQKVLIKLLKSISNKTQKIFQKKKFAKLTLL